MKNLKEKIENNKALKILIKVFKTIAMVIVICLLLVIVVQKVSSNNVNLGGYGVYTVVTGSMDPTLKVKDMILSKKVDPESLNTGDIVVYNGNEGSFSGKIVTHRIIKKEKRDNVLYFTTKGDANQIEDKEITANQIVGKFVTKLTILSLISHIINNTVGFFFIVFVPFIIFVFCEVISVKNEIDKEKSES